MRLKFKRVDRRNKMGITKRHRFGLDYQCDKCKLSPDHCKCHLKNDDSRGASMSLIELIIGWAEKFSCMVDNGEESGGASMLEVEADRLLDASKDKIEHLSGESLERFYKCERLEEEKKKLEAFYAAVVGWRENDWPEGFCRRTAELIAERGKEAS